MGNEKDNETPGEKLNINMTLQVLIKENSWLFCRHCDYRTKFNKGLRRHIVEIHDKTKTDEPDLVKCYRYV